MVRQRLVKSFRFQRRLTSNCQVFVKIPSAISRAGFVESGIQRRVHHLLQLRCRRDQTVRIGAQVHTPLGGSSLVLRDFSHKAQTGARALEHAARS